MTQNGTRHHVIIGGAGGKGILTIGKILAEAGLVNYAHVSYFPNYGALMRGGDSEVTVTLSDEVISSQGLMHPEAAIAMSPDFFNMLLPRVLPGGLFLADEAVVPAKKEERDDINLYVIPVTAKALELGNTQVANLILLGAYIEATGVLPINQIEAALDKRLLGTRRENLLPLNKKALHEGARTMAALIGK